MLTRTGFTIAEALVSLVLLGVVAGATLRLLGATRRTYEQQAARSELDANLRAASAMIPAELAELDPGDAWGTDLITATDSGLTYGASRNVSFVCGVALDAGAAGEIVVRRDPVLGLRALDPDRDSLAVFADRDAAIDDDDYWAHADVASVDDAATCPDGSPGRRLLLTAVTPAGALADVLPGAAARALEIMQLESYVDVYRDRWLGLRQHAKATGWGAVQPVLGPLEEGGLTFRYLGANGAATDPGVAAAVFVRVAGKSARSAGAGGRYLTDTLDLWIALRNAPRP